MYIVNTTFAVEHPRHEQWLGIIKNHYVPLLRQKGYGRVVLSRVISERADDHFTYSLQVDVPDIPACQELTGAVFSQYLAVADPLFGSGVLYFTTIMKKTGTDE